MRAVVLVLAVLAAGCVRAPTDKLGDCILTAVLEAEHNPNEPRAARCGSEKTVWLVAMSWHDRKEELTARGVPDDIAAGLTRGKNFDEQVCVARRTASPEEVAEWDRSAKEGSITLFQTSCYPTKVAVRGLSVARGTVFELRFERAGADRAVLSEIVAVQ